MLRRFRIPLVASILLGLSATVAMAGKPTPPPPPPSPVKYMVKTFQMPVPTDSSSGVETHQMTSSGVVVGAYRVNGDRHPFMYNALIDAETAIDLNDFTSVGMPEVVGLEPGWRIAAALDINEYGYVVGAMCHVDTPEVWRGYLLDLNTSPPQLSRLPDGSEHTYARRINDRMDILGVTPNAVSNRAYLYNPLLDSQTHDLGIDVWQTVELSNAAIGQPAKVAGRLVNGDAFRYTAGAGLDAGFGFEGNAIDINPSGKVCGNYR